jgi:hypothetical protein
VETDNPVTDNRSMKVMRILARLTHNTTDGRVVDDEDVQQYFCVVKTGQKNGKFETKIDHEIWANAWMPSRVFEINKLWIE